MNEYMTWREFKEKLGVTDDGSRDDLLVILQICDKNWHRSPDEMFAYPPNSVLVSLKDKQHIHANMPDTDVIRLSFQYNDEDFSE